MITIIEENYINYCQVNINLDSGGDIHTTIKSVSELDKTKENIIFNVTYTCGNYVKSGCYLVIVCIVNELRSQGKTVTVNFDTNQECDTIRYASRINFFNSIEINYTENFKRHDTSGSLVEITKISQDSYGLDENINQLLKKNFELTDEDSETLIKIFYELISNITLHAKSKNGGYLYCQRYKKTTELIIIDAGIGIRKSLNAAYPEYTNEVSLQECIKHEVTDGNGRGIGLFYISELLKKNKGVLVIISGNNSIVIEENNTKIYPFPNWEGTIIKCIFNNNNPLSSK